MTKVIIKSDKLVGELETFLDNMFWGITDHLPYQITKLEEHFEIEISDLAKDHLVSYDHDCKTQSGGGCNYCSKLADLDLIPVATSPKDFS